MKHVGGRAVISDIKRQGAHSEHTWNKAAIPLNLAGSQVSQVKIALNCIRDEILVTEYDIIKKVHLAKSGNLKLKDVAHRHGAFGTVTDHLKKEGFVVKPKFVTNRALDILEQMSIKYLPTRKLLSVSRKRGLDQCCLLSRNRL